VTDHYRGTLMRCPVDQLFDPALLTCRRNTVVCDQYASACPNDCPLLH